LACAGAAPVVCLFSVTFNYLGRDFFNALSEKDVDGFKLQLVKYLIGFCFGKGLPCAPIRSKGSGS